MNSVSFSSVSVCPPATYIDEKTKECKECPPGTFNGETGLKTQCLACKLGEFSSKGAKSCTSCEIGHGSNTDKNGCGE